MAETFPYYKYFFKPLLMSTNNNPESEYENKKQFLLMKIIQQNSFAQLIHLIKWLFSHKLFVSRRGEKYKKEIICQINYTLRIISPVKAEMNIHDLHHFQFNLLLLDLFRLFSLY